MINALTTQDELLLKTFKWTVSVSEYISRAGGNPSKILTMFPDDLLIHLIRNDLYVVYVPEVTKMP
jgi:hypothetical protein